MHLEKVGPIPFYGLSLHVHILFQGIATREDIDTTLKLGMNHPMGPLQLGTVFDLRSNSTNLTRPPHFFLADL